MHGGYERAPMGTAAVQSAARSKQRKIRFIELLEGQVHVLQQQLSWLQGERGTLQQQFNQIGEAPATAASHGLHWE